jgi:hypothetical protein
LSGKVAVKTVTALPFARFGKEIGASPSGVTSQTRVVASIDKFP